MAQDGVTCETTLRNQGAQVSPHLLAQIDEMAQASAAAAPPLSEDQERALTKILHAQGAPFAGGQTRPDMY